VNFGLKVDEGRLESLYQPIRSLLKHVFIATVAMTNVRSLLGSLAILLQTTNIDWDMDKVVWS
jgi:hypothetical protein